MLPQKCKTHPVENETEITEHESFSRRPGPLRLEPEEFLVVQTPADKPALTPGGSASPALPPAAPGAIPAPTGHTVGQTGRGGGVVSTSVHLVENCFDQQN